MCLGIPGEVIELSLSNLNDAGPLLQNLRDALAANHLNAVPVGQLMRGLPERPQCRTQLVKVPLPFLCA